MKPKHCYLGLAILGVIVPLVPFAPWLAKHGLNLRLLVQELFANRVSAFFGLDVVVSAVVVVAFAYIERERISTRLWWVPVLAVLFVGVSFGLPLLLFLREREPSRHPSGGVKLG